MIARLLAGIVTSFAWVLTGVRSNWAGCLPESRPRVYFANHRSHGDFVLIWSVLPSRLRQRTRPVAAADYWGRTPLHRFIAQHVFHAVLIARDGASRDVDPVAQLRAVLEAGDSLIFFPEGTRNTTDGPLLPFKSGIYRLARSCTDLEMVPAWIDNLNRVLPKGALLPVPLLCTVTFGAPLRLGDGEGSVPFRERSRSALLDLRPAEQPG